MRKLTYIVNGVEIAEYAKAKALQPNGRLETKLAEVDEYSEDFRNAQAERAKKFWANR